MTKGPIKGPSSDPAGAGDEIRTHDPNLGKIEYGIRQSTMLFDIVLIINIYSVNFGTRLADCALRLYAKCLQNAYIFRSGMIM